MEGEEDNTAPDLPHDKKLIQRCRDEVLESRGLTGLNIAEKGGE